MSGARSGGRRYGEGAESVKPALVKPVSTTRLEQDLWPKGYRRDVWMVVDAARDQRIFGMLLESRLQFSCLYSGPVPPALETLAPYLVQLEHDDTRCRRFLQRAVGNSWGIYLKCDTTLERLRKHLRGFLSVRDPAGNKLLFRYYDPRVMRVYLPTCSSEDLRTVFGPIDRFWVEGESADKLLDFSLDGSRLLRRDISLDDSAPPPALAPAAATATTMAPIRQRPGMLPMRKEQIAAFSAAEVNKFEDWMVTHLRKFFPRQCNQLGELPLRETIRYGISRAANYGLLAKRDVCKYIDVMLVLGRDFDKDRRYPWAAGTLGRTMDPGVKMQTVLVAAQRSLGKR